MTTLTNTPQPQQPQQPQLQIQTQPDTIYNNNESPQLRKITQPPNLRIIPPLNFCPVEKQLYRSGQPSMINESF